MDAHCSSKSGLGATSPFAGILSWGWLPGLITHGLFALGLFAPLWLFATLGLFATASRGPGIGFGLGLRFGLCLWLGRLGISQKRPQRTKG